MPGLHHHADRDTVLKIDALISHYLHIPFPEELDDDTWAIKWAQARFIIDLQNNAQ